MDEEKLYVSKIMVDEGPRLKRLNPRAMGRADIIHKKTSHITVVVSEK
jgi:large subunit ribosomal protein L22